MRRLNLMLSDKDKVFLLKKITKQMKHNHMSLSEVIDLMQETIDYLRTVDSDV